MLNKASNLDHKYDISFFPTQYFYNKLYDVSKKNVELFVFSKQIITTGKV